MGSRGGVAKAHFQHAGVTVEEFEIGIDVPKLSLCSYGVVEHLSDVINIKFVLAIFLCESHNGSVSKHNFNQIRSNEHLE